MTITLGAIASVASTIASVLIAAVALLFSYRQNVGWKPALLLHNATMGRGAVKDKDTTNLSIKVELWNRRKYPVVVTWVAADLKGAEARDEPFTGSDQPYFRDGRWSVVYQKVVQPHAFHEQTITFGISRQSLDAMRPEFDVRVTFYDPIKNKDDVVKGCHRFFYPELGWKLSKSERDAARARYRELQPAPTPTAKEP